MTESLMYKGETVIFQEVPDEISLALNIYGCPRHCENCHSEYLWDTSSPDGSRVVYKDIPKLLDKYGNLITCLCFMGGDWNLDSLIPCILRAKQIKPDLKICVYSGQDSLSEIEDLIPYVDYLKIGRYDKNLGGFDSPITNQKFYKKENNQLIDITKKFQSKRF